LNFIKNGGITRCPVGLLQNKLNTPITVRTYKVKKINSIFYKKNNLDNISINFEKSEQFIEKASNLLQQNGVLVIKNFYPQKEAIELGQKVHKRITDYAKQLQKNPNSIIINNELYGQIGLTKFKRYQEIANADKPVLIVRAIEEGVADSGFIDLFNANDFFSDDTEFTKCESCMKQDIISRILSSNTNYPNRQMNLYINNGIINTRGPHIDNLSNSYKCFLYLSNVDTLDKGPYTYIPGSHKGSLLKKFNIFVNKFYKNIKLTDMQVNNDLAVKIKGDAGTLIISNQSGIHGGHPQSRDSERVVLVNNYF